MSRGEGIKRDKKEEKEIEVPEPKDTGLRTAKAP